MRTSDKRICVMVGHYGSGKSEFSINYATYLARQGLHTALCDMDIANPYFRSRERQSLLEACNIEVYSNAFGYDITADLPAITAGVRKPFEDTSCHTVVDSGGDAGGARVLNQFTKYFKNEDCDIFCIVNANRRETGNLSGVLEHIKQIEDETNLKITGIVNNTHMVWETTCDDILKGQELCIKVSEALRVPIKYTCCIERLINELEEIKKKNIELQGMTIFPINLYLRESWQ